MTTSYQHCESNKNRRGRDIPRPHYEMFNPVPCMTIPVSTVIPFNMNIISFKIDVSCWLVFCLLLCLLVCLFVCLFMKHTYLETLLHTEVTHFFVDLIPWREIMVQWYVAKFGLSNKKKMENTFNKCYLELLSSIWAWINI